MRWYIIPCMMSNIIYQHKYNVNEVCNVMKYDNDYYLQLSRHLFDDKYFNLSVNAKWLFVVLNELEQRYCSRDKNYFYRTDNDLVEDSGLSLSTVKRAKKELIEAGLISCNLSPFISDVTNKKSKMHVTVYEILI